jgi:hypothetical protein
VGLALASPYLTLTRTLHHSQRKNCRAQRRHTPAMRATWMRPRARDFFDCWSIRVPCRDGDRFSPRAIRTLRATPQAVRYMSPVPRRGKVPVVPPGDLLDAVADVLDRAAVEVDLRVRADLLARARNTVDAFLRGDLSADEAIAALTEPRSGVRERR